VARATPESFDEACAAVDCAVAVAERRHLTSSLVQGLAVRALVERSRGDVNRAAASMARSLELGEPGRFTRAFVELGAPLIELLVELARHGNLPTEGQRVLDACQAGVGTQTPSQPKVNRPAQPLVEALTWRELDVLSLMDAHLMNKQIAQRLSISEETVKKHAVNIYGKLQAKGRRDAVIRAYALGILQAEVRRTPRPA
jgi:LuxR family maltose regulon positive regulatory protein